MALAGGWIDQPFVSSHNPDAARLHGGGRSGTRLWFMDRCGMASGTRRVAPRSVERRAAGPAAARSSSANCTAAENDGKAEPSGSQDMIGLIYPGVSRLDYDAALRGRLFSRRTSSPTAIPPSRAGWSAFFSSCPSISGPRATIRWASRTSIRSGSGAWARPARTASTPSSAGTSRALGRFHEPLHGVLGGDPAAHRAHPTIRHRSESDSRPTSSPAIPAPCIPAAAAAT